MLRKALATVLMALAAFSSAQTGRTLTDYLATSKTTPMFAVEPDRVKATGAGTSLSDFHRKKVALGELTAIVPEKMVVIDDSFQQPPNLYDGLDRNSKILYLLTTLNGGQWDLVTKGGIGYGDLDDAQKKVFISLLPKPFDWHSYPVDHDGLEGQKKGGGELSDNELPNVKLYVRRQMAFRVKLANNQGESEFRESNLGGEPGTTAFARDMDVSKADSFGVLVRQNLDNELKPSDMDYTASGLKKFTQLPAKTTVRELLEQIRAVSGYEIHADIRVADRAIWLTGDKARIVNVLKALALAVTGTYRQVGSAYVLTSDLIGLGSRKLRFGIWTNDLRDRQYKLQDDWKKRLSRTVMWTRSGSTPTTVRPRLPRFSRS
jgi:hypothetical protein